MFGRSGLLLLVLAGAVGIPYLSSRSPAIMNSVSGLWKSGDKSTAAPAIAGNSAAGKDPVAAAVQKMSDAGPKLPSDPAQSLAEVLRFDVTSQWVMTRWPRVSAGLAQLDLQGYRVPLVTGTTPEDLAGSLTYYFDKKQQVDRITFRGTTGNPRQLIALLTSKYAFLVQPTSDPALHVYQVKWNGKPWSELRIRTARVVRADAPRTRYEVDLAMRRP